MTKTHKALHSFPYLLPEDRVVAAKGFRWGCIRIKKGQRGVVVMTIIVPDGVWYRVRWKDRVTTETSPLVLKLTKRKAADQVKIHGGKS